MPASAPSACDGASASGSVTFDEVPGGTSGLSVSAAPRSVVCIEGRGEVIIRDQLGIPTLASDELTCDGTPVSTDTLSIIGWHLRD